jgi:hypothetical protein
VRDIFEANRVTNRPNEMDPLRSEESDSFGGFDDPDEEEALGGQDEYAPERRWESRYSREKPSTE